MLTVWLLLRSPLASGSSPPRRPTAGTSARRRSSAGSASSSASRSGSGSRSPSARFRSPSELLGIYAGITLLFVAGLVDDLRALPPLAKLAAQIAAAAIVARHGHHVQLVHTPIVARPLALFWLVGMTNAFNLLDNMDGLAATLAAIAFVFFAIDAVTIHPNDTVLVLALAGAFACVGFLPFNLRPHGTALVFMGDSGSQVLGFTLAALGLARQLERRRNDRRDVPAADSHPRGARSSTRRSSPSSRLLDGRPIYQGGRDHSSHRLVRFGLSEKHAVLLLALIAIALGGTSLAYNVLDNQRLTLVGVLVTFVLLVQFASFLADVERRRARRRAGGLQTFRRPLAPPRRGRRRLLW